MHTLSLSLSLSLSVVRLMLNVFFEHVLRSGTRVFSKQDPCQKKSVSNH